MSEHAVAAMMFPIVMEIVNALNLKKGESVFGKGLFFAMAWGCIIGGATTVLGGGRVPLAVEILEKTTQGKGTIGLLEYTQLSFPLVVILLACGWVVLRTLFPPEVADIGPAREVLHKKSLAMVASASTSRPSTSPPPSPRPHTSRSGRRLKDADDASLGPMGPSTLEPSSVLKS